MENLTEDEMQQLSKLDQYWRKRLSDDSRSVIESLIEKGFVERKRQHRQGFPEMYRLASKSFGLDCGNHFSGISTRRKLDQADGKEDNTGSRKGDVDTKSLDIFHHPRKAWLRQ